MENNGHCDKAALIEVWRQVRQQAGPESMYAPVDLKEAILLVNQTFALLENRTLSWDELISEADIDESDAAFIIRRALYAAEVSLVKAKFVIVSVNEEDEYLIECFQRKREKAEAIATLLRSCSLFFDIQVRAMQEYLDIVEEETEVFSEETEMAFKSLMKS